VFEEWSPESAAFKSVWKVFSRMISRAILEKRGWFDRTYLGINENPLNFTMAAAKVIQGAFAQVENHVTPETGIRSWMLCWMIILQSSPANQACKRHGSVRHEGPPTTLLRVL